MAYLWFSFVMAGTAPLSDIRPILRLRGWLTRPCFRSCGQRLEIASGVRINYTTDLTLGDDVYLGPGCWINAYGGTTIDDQVMLGPYTVVVTTKHTQIDGSYRFGKPDMSPIHIGRGSWTAAHVVVSSGVRIGRGVLVAACAVVTKDVPDGCVVGGVPARVIRSGHSDEADLSTLSPDARPDVSTSQRR